MAAKDMDGAEALATVDSGAAAAEHQPDVETPKEIATPMAAAKASPDERRAAMAAENASAMQPVNDDKVREERDRRATEMAQENANAAMPLDDSDAREERALRAAQMAQESATGAAH